jgi:hypothetical protein
VNTPNYNDYCNSGIHEYMDFFIANTLMLCHTLVQYKILNDARRDVGSNQFERINKQRKRERRPGFGASSYA